MSSLNNVVLLGNLTRDPEYRELDNGTAVADTGLALNRKYKDSSGQLQEEVTYVDLSFWGNQVKTLRDYCHKGKQLAIEGRLKLDQWETNQGENRSKLRVVVERMHFTGSKSDQTTAGERAGMPAAYKPQPQERPQVAQNVQRDEFGDPVQNDNIPGLERGSVPVSQVPEDRF